MFNKRIRAIFQVNFMVGVIGFAALTGWACDCGSGSDHSGGEFEARLTTREVQAVDGTLDRWHDFSDSGGSLNDKDLDFLHEWLQNDGVSIGMLVPQAPDAIEPGSLTTATHSIYLNYTAGGVMQFLYIPLEPDDAAVQNLNALFPPEPGTQWQALKPANFDWLGQVPTQTVEMTDIGGSLYYQIDFHGNEVCNHCEVQLTGCSTRQFSFGEQVLLRTMGMDQVTTNGELTCADPVGTTILLSDGFDPAPGPLVLSFGFWGGEVYTTTLSGDVAVPYMLAHTDLVTQTVNLGTIQSAQGWNYHWEDMSGAPISQVDVGPLQSPLYLHLNEPNIRLVSSGLPTCEKALDQVDLSASLTLTPTVTASHMLSVQVLPDEATCSVKDVGIYQIASTAAITAGQSVEFTWTITNFESTPSEVIVTGAFSPETALSGATLPAGCSRTGGAITCQVNGIPADDSRVLLVSVDVSTAYNGPLRSYVEVEPVGAVDARFYDNTSGPLYISVTGGVSYPSIYLPFIIR